MPVYKGKDGKIYEENAPQATIGKDQRTLASSSGGNAAQGSSDDRTRLGDGGEQPASTPERTDAFNQKTQLAGVAGPPASSPGQQTSPARGVPGGTPAAAEPFDQGAEKTSLVGGLPVEDGQTADPMISEDPVVGWLVIENGPGRGSAVQVGVGMNSVGRGADQRIRIDFGDTAISSVKHFFVSYDPRSRQFGVHRGDGPNITYLNGAPIYGSEVLPTMAQIEVGSTTLRFVALCGEDFSWTE